MQLCNYCQGISPASISAEEDVIGRSGRPTIRLGYAHLPNYEDLAASARSCPMCRLLQRIFNEGN